MDDARPPVSRMAMRAARLAIAMVMLAPAASLAHVGSPDVVYEGNAGAYAIRVIVRPPQVVPGLADVVVRVLSGEPSRVLIQPVFWRAGVTGAPSPDETRPVPGAPRTYTGQLWLMARGAYSVYVTVEGASGKGRAMVPVMSVATARLGMSPALGVLLVALGLLLVAGLVSIVYAAAGEGIVEAGRPIEATRRRRARLVASISAPVIALALLGGAKWWRSVDADYKTRMYRPISMSASIVVGAAGPRLHFTALEGALDPLLPEHGKLMHLFVIDSARMQVFAHLHPAFNELATFTTPIPPLPVGSYRLFGDVAFENGQTRTLTGSVTVTAEDSARAGSLGDQDDAWTTAPGVVRHGGSAAVAPLEDGSSMEWLADSPIRAGTVTTLRFRVLDPTGAPATLAPYLGMNAHAVITRTDGSTFIHLHPIGTVSPAVQAAFALRDRGDTTPSGRLRSAPEDSSMQRMSVSNEFEIPYEFPRSGRYRIWVQVRRASRVLTGVYDVDL